MQQGPRVAIIGLDCGAPSLLFDQLADEVPNLQKLFSNGMYGDLASITPPITPTRVYGRTTILTTTHLVHPRP